MFINMKHIVIFCVCIWIICVSAAAQNVVPIFEEGEAQVIDAFKDTDNWILHDLWVETDFDSDGDGRKDRMHVDVTRPVHTDTEGLQLPVVYNTSPYFAGIASGTDFFWDVRHELGEAPPKRTVAPGIKRTGARPSISRGHIKEWMPRGYIVVHSSSPGTGLSDGAPTIGGENESMAPQAVIEWLCGRRKGYTERDGNEEVEAYWSTGKVGMIGTSYNGTLPIAAACTGVEGLEAIIPIAPNTSYYHYYRSHGLIRHPGGYLGEDIDVLYDFVHSGDEDKRARNNEVVRDTEMAEGLDRVSGDYNAFWEDRDYLNKMDKFQAALLMSHGFNDWNVMPEHSYRIYSAARNNGVDAQIFYHQAGHGGPPPLKMMNRWFTRYLHGIENGVEDEPKSWIVREDDKRSDPTAYPDYPHPEAQPVDLYLEAGAPSYGALTTTRNPGAETETIVDNFSFSPQSLAQAEYTNHRLLYLTPELKSDVHISGIAKVEITLSSNVEAVNLSAYLISLPWNEGRRAKITDNIITRGWADPQNHRSLTESEPLVPGRKYTVEFELQPDDQIVKAGQQIGLMIFSSDKDFTIWPDPGSEITVDLDGTKISIPIVGGKTAYDKAVKG